MGIPITGTITQFQSKLTQKGCTYDKSSSSLLPGGVRVFNGSFAGNKVIIYAYYNSSTKIVYRAKAVISGNTENIADQKYAEMLDLFKQKYYTADFDFASQDGKESLRIDFANGHIDMFISKDAEIYIRYPYNYDVHIDYWDSINSNSNTNSKLDDI